MKIQQRGPEGSSLDRWILSLRHKGSRQLSSEYIEWIKNRNYKESSDMRSLVTADIVMAIRQGIITREHRDSLYSYYPFLREYMSLSKSITKEPV